MTLGLIPLQEVLAGLQRGESWYFYSQAYPNDQPPHYPEFVKSGSPGRLWVDVYPVGLRQVSAASITGISPGPSLPPEPCTWDQKVRGWRFGTPTPPAVLDQLRRRIAQDLRHWRVRMPTRNSKRTGEPATVTVQAHTERGAKEAAIPELWQHVGPRFYIGPEGHITSPRGFRSWVLHRSRAPGILVAQPLTLAWVATSRNPVQLRKTGVRPEDTPYTTAQQAVVARYHQAPVFVWLGKRPPYEGPGWVEVRVPLDRVVADLAALVVDGARFAGTTHLVWPGGNPPPPELRPFAEADGAVSVSLLVARTEAARAATQLTGTAAILGGVPGEYVVRGRDGAPPEQLQLRLGAVAPLFVAGWFDGYDAMHVDTVATREALAKLSHPGDARYRWRYAHSKVFWWERPTVEAFDKVDTWLLARSQVATHYVINDSRPITVESLVALRSACNLVSLEVGEHPFPRPALPRLP